MNIEITPAQASDVSAWTAMRREMGPDWVTADFESLTREYLQTGRIQGMPHCVFLARDETQARVGFAEVSLRQYAEGCLTRPVGFLEGWFVRDSARRHGVGKALVSACEAWAQSQGCTEFASDAELDNTVSLAAHEALGFESVGDIRCFRKALGKPH